MTIAAVVDIETTSLHAAKGDEIIEICIAIVDIEKRTIPLIETKRFKPTVKIAPKAQAIHGICLADLEHEGAFTDYVPRLLELLNSADLFIAHNVGFDLEFIREVLVRLDVPWTPPQHYCTMDSGRWATFDGKSPRLSELCFASGVDYDPAEAHAAIYDVQKTIECLFFGLRMSAFVLPEPIAVAA